LTVVVKTDAVRIFFVFRIYKIYTMSECIIMFFFQTVFLSYLESLRKACNKR